MDDTCKLEKITASMCVVQFLQALKQIAEQKLKQEPDLWVEDG